MLMRIAASVALAALAIRRLFRDRRGLVFTVALPFTVILLVGLAFGDDDGTIQVGVTTVADSTRIAQALEAQPSLEVQSFATEADLRDAVLRGRVQAGVLLTAVEVPRLILGADSAAGATVRPLIGAVLVRASAPGPTPGAGAGAESSPGVADVAVERVGSGGGIASLSTFGYTAPANLILFSFITTLAAAAGLIEARQLGVRRRMFAAPIGARHILAGEAMGRFGIAVVQSLVVVTGASLLFGVQWGDPFAVGVVVAAFALVATAAGMLLGTLLTTPQQASAIGPIAGIALGMLGGCMWPLEIVGDTMRTVGHATPHAWAVDALVAIGTGSGLSAVGTEVAVLLAFAAVLLPLAVWRLRPQ